MSEIKYRPEIDGLRTIAVIPVILFHTGFSWIDGGYFGVDVFFVISGFFISTIILKNTYSGSFSFKEFWMRRVRRIVPALVVMVLTSLLSAYFLVFKPFLLTYHDALSAVFSYANFAMLIKFGDYWGSAAESRLFLHCWSLSELSYFFPLYISTAIFYSAISLLGLCNKNHFPFEENLISCVGAELQFNSCRLPVMVFLNSAPCIPLFLLTYATASHVPEGSHVTSRVYIPKNRR